MSVSTSQALLPRYANVKYSDRTQVNKTLEWPTFIEVAGTPNAGKNTIVIPILEVFLRDILGFKVVKLDEAVTYCPIGREFSVDRLWHSINQTCNLSLEAFREQGNNFVIQNRGLFDRLAFVHAFRLAEQIDAATERVFRDSILLCQKHIRVELVLLLTIQRDVSLQREAKEITTSVIGDLKNRFGNASRVPTQSMVAPESLDRLNAAYEYAKEEYSKQFNVVTVPDPTDSKAFAEWLVDLDSPRLKGVLSNAKPTQFASRPVDQSDLVSHHLRIHNPPPISSGPVDVGAVRP